MNLAKWMVVAALAAGTAMAEDATKAFEVVKRTPVMAASATDVGEGEDVTVIATLVDAEDATGTVFVYVGGDEYSAAVEDGAANVIVSELAPGYYSATVEYSGDDTYFGVSANVSFKVGRPQEEVDGVVWYYEPLEAGTAMVTGVASNHATGNLTMPEQLGGLTVTEVGYEAFRDCTNITGMAIAGGVTIIIEDAFHGCVGLTDMTISDSVTDIGMHAFEGCNSLTNVWLGTGIESVGEDAFATCSQLATVWAPVEQEGTGLLDAAGLPDECVIHYYGTQWVTFDANGGACGTATNGYTVGETYGPLPEADREGFAFAGWWDEAAGEEVTKDGTVTEKAARTLVAHWNEPPPPPVVSNVVARQRWPWNGLVDVDYEVGGETDGLEARISFAASDGRSWVATNFLAGAKPSAAPGAHRATWNAPADGVTDVVAGSVTATVELVPQPTFPYVPRIRAIVGETKAVQLFVVPNGEELNFANALPNEDFYVYAPLAGSDSVSFTLAGSGESLANGHHVNSGENMTILVSVKGLRPVRDVVVGTSKTDDLSDVIIHRVFDFYESDDDPDAAAAASSAEFRLDTREGPLPSDGTETLTYSTRWHPAGDATVTILQRDAAAPIAPAVPVASGLFDEGDAVWQVFEGGTYVLAHATVAGDTTVSDEETATFVVPDRPPVVSNVVARQRWPWNGLVDVDYAVGGYTTGLAARVVFAASDGRSWTATNFLAGAEPSAEPGRHRATWDTAADGAANVVAGSVAATVELVRTSFRRLALDFGGFGVRTDAASYRATLYDGAGNPTKGPLTAAIGDAPPPAAIFEFVPFATRRAVVEFLDGDGNVLCETAVEGDAFPRPSSDRMVVVPVREGDPVTLRVVHAWPAETETADVRIVYDDGVEKRAFVEGAAFDAASGTCEAVFGTSGGAASVKSVTLLRNGIAFEWLDYATAPASADGALELDVDGNEFANGAYAAGTAMQVANPRHLDNVRNHPRGGSFVQVKDIDFAGSCGILNAVAIAKGAKGTTITSTRSVVDAKARFYGREVGDYGWFYGWLPIGSEASPFVGAYDGGGFRIANAVGNAVDASDSHALSGLFGIVGDENAEGAETVVTNVVLAGSCSFHSNYLSALVCKNRGRLAIRDCDSAAEHFSAQYAAGMCAEQHEEDKRGWHVSIDGCRTGGRILGKWCGGMLSYVSYGFAALSGCVFDGTMVAGDNLGGMVYYCGINTDARCTIGNCTVKGTLSIPNGATIPASGGLIGELKATLALTGNNLASCEMEYSGSKKIGGVIGRSDFSEANLRAVLSGHVTVAAGVVHDVSQENKIGTYCGEPWIDSL